MSKEPESFHEWNEIVRLTGRCAVTGASLIDCESVCFVQLDFFAWWEFPSWGNINVNTTKHFAMAIVHERAFVNGEFIGPIREAVEFTSEGTIVFHPLESLEPIDELTQAHLYQQKFRMQ